MSSKSAKSRVLGKLMATSDLEKKSNRCYVSIDIEKKIIDDRSVVCARIHSDSDYPTVCNTSEMAQQPLTTEYTDMNEVGKIVTDILNAKAKGLK
jgi:uncharacterized SAM-dependent methyltransferase